MMEHRVAVILPTYNGERYIERQIESILAQSYELIDIYVYDDGSTDSTVNTVRRIIEVNDSKKNIILLAPTDKNLGCPESFYHILNQAPDYDYYAFSDQDDVWLPNKIERAISALQKNAVGIPLVYFSSFRYVDEKLRFIRNAPSPRLPIKMKDTLFTTPGLGFTIVFDRNAYNDFILMHAHGKLMHDRWILLCASCMGKILYDSEPTALHVRHDSAVTASDNKAWDLFFNFIKAELLGSDTKELFNKIREFKEIYWGNLSEENQKILDLFTCEKSIPKQIQKVFFPSKLRETWGGEFALRALFALGRL